MSAVLTPAMISLIVTLPSLSVSPTAHAETGALPRAMLTMMMSSLTVTSPEPSQSATQVTGVLVKLGVAVAVGGAVGVVVSRGL